MKRFFSVKDYLQTPKTNTHLFTANTDWRVLSFQYYSSPKILADSCTAQNENKTNILRPQLCCGCPRVRLLHKSLHSLRSYFECSRHQSRKPKNTENWREHTDTKNSKLLQISPRAACLLLSRHFGENMMSVHSTEDSRPTRTADRSVSRKCGEEASAATKRNDPRRASTKEPRSRREARGDCGVEA